MSNVKEEQAHANYGVLIELKDSVMSIGTRFDKFASQQNEENQRLHARIDATQEKFINTIGSLKDGMAERGRITLPLVASVLSMIAILSGAGAAYVSMTTSPLRDAIIENARKISVNEGKGLTTSERLQALEVDTRARDERSETDRQWTKELLNEVRHKTP